MASGIMTRKSFASRTLFASRELFAWGGPHRARAGVALCSSAVALALVGAGPAAAQQPPAAVKFVGTATSPISASVLIPANRAAMWISGTTPPVVKADAPAGSRERYGDTETQAAGVLKNIEAQRRSGGLLCASFILLGLLDARRWLRASAHQLADRRAVVEQRHRPAREVVERLIGIDAHVVAKWPLAVSRRIFQG